MNRSIILEEIYTLIKHLSDKEFQERVWLRGEGPEVSSYVELMCSLFDDYNFDEIIDNYQEFNLSNELVSKLDELRCMLNSYEGEDIEVAKMLKDFRWEEIRKLSEAILPIFKKEI